MQNRLTFADVTVDFPIYDVRSRSLKRRLVLDRMSKLMGKTEPHVGGAVRDDGRTILVRALDQINLTIADGDRVGLVGHNGAGKTTLLRVAAGIYEPTFGEVTTHGRVMTLFNMMEGLAVDATGREMIRLRGALLGLSEQEIDEKESEIAEFCELGAYMDMPVRTYSAGMLVRLAFSITTAVSSEILIMDELIGAGDAGFFERAQVRLKGFVEKARVLVVATHSAEIVRHWCNKAVLLSHGKVVEFGPVDAVIAAYERTA
jgi:ABC-type polysaccharide/polyol phosphate transport system ATPase subunit